MTYTLDDLAWVLSRLSSRGVRFVVIGSTVIDLELRRRSFEDDIDVFALEPSPLVEEEFYRELASKEGWELSYTALGTPKLVVKVPSGGEVIVEVYENIHDFYIPPEILEQAPTKRIKGVSVRLLRPEDYIVLKAKAARDTDIEDLRIIREYIEEGRLRVNERIIRADLELLPEEDRRLAESKLRDLGFRV